MSARRGLAAVGLVLLAAAAALLAAVPAGAETLEVTSEAESGPGSLGETILEAGQGDVISLPPGEYLLTNGDTLIEQGNVLRGAGAERTVVVPSGGGEALSEVSYSGITIAPARQGADEDGGAAIESRAQVIAIVVTVAIFLLILELVRRRRLVERYALVWMLSAIALLVLAIWTDGLEVIADAMGIEEPANAIFILSFGVVFLLLLNFSVATSRLSEQNSILAQETARLEQEVRSLREDGDGRAEGR